MQLPAILNAITGLGHCLSIYPFLLHGLLAQKMK